VTTGGLFVVVGAVVVGAGAGAIGGWELDPSSLDPSSLDPSSLDPSSLVVVDGLIVVVAACALTVAVAAVESDRVTAMATAPRTLAAPTPRVTAESLASPCLRASCRACAEVCELFMLCSDPAPGCAQGWLLAAHVFTFRPISVLTLGGSSESPLRVDSRVNTPQSAATSRAEPLQPRASNQATQKEIPVWVDNVYSIDLPLRWVTTKENYMSNNEIGNNEMSNNEMSNNEMSNNEMSNNEPVKARGRKQLVGAVGLLLAGGLAGGVLAATSSASAADTAASTAAAPAAAAPAPRADTGTPVRPGETALTGTNAATAKAAALKAVPGGTVYRVETDTDGATYEAHMTKADGTHVTVKFDKNFAVTAIEDGMGAGGHRGPGGAFGGTAPSSTGATA
jgi:hypothetical protein